MRLSTLIFLFLCTAIGGGGVPTLDRYAAIVKRLLVGPTNLKYSNAVIFDRNQGEVNREHYRRAFGHQGNRLIDIYGKGIPKEHLRAWGYI